MNSDFEIKNGILEKYNGNTADVIVPDGVTVVGARAFAFCDNVVSIKLPESVTKIGKTAFMYCKSLEKLYIPDSVTTMEDYLFEGCNALKKITFSRNCEYYQYVYEWNYDFHFTAYELCVMLCCGDLKGPDSLIKLLQTKIKNNRKHVLSGIAEADDGEAMAYLLSLFKKVPLNDLNNWLHIVAGKPGASAVLLTYRKNNYTQIEEQVHVTEEQEKSLGMKERTYADWRKIFKISIAKNGNASIVEYKISAPHVVIPSKIGKYPVVQINEYAFSNSDVSSVFISDGIERIQTGAFSNCKQLLSVSLPEGLLEIGKHAFEGCVQLATLSIPNSIRSISFHAFAGCEHLTSLTIPEGVESICEGAFRECGLENIVIPSGVKEIKAGAFSNCVKLSSICVAETVTSISGDAFEGTAWQKSQPDGFVRIGNVLYGYAGDHHSIKSITVPESIISISSRGFYGWENLDSVVLPDTLKEIQTEAFADCTSLTKVILPEGLCKIGTGAFRNCNNLKEIQVPDSVADIGEGAFYGTAWYDVQPMGIVYAGKVLYKLKSYTAETVPMELFDEFWANRNIPVLEIPEGTVGIAAGALANPPGNIGLIRMPVSLKVCGFHSFWSCNVEKVAIDNIEKWCSIDFDVAGNPLSDTRELYVNNEPVHNLVIPETVKKINKHAFFCARPLYSVDIEDGVEEIDNEAFAYCGNLRSITIASSVKKIHADAFAHMANYTIHTPKGSFAEQFAREHRINCIIE